MNNLQYICSNNINHSYSIRIPQTVFLHTTENNATCWWAGLWPSLLHLMVWSIISITLSKPTFTLRTRLCYSGSTTCLLSADPGRHRLCPCHWTAFPSNLIRGLSWCVVVHDIRVVITLYSAAAQTWLIYAHISPHSCYHQIKLLEVDAITCRVVALFHHANTFKTFSGSYGTSLSCWASVWHIIMLDWIRCFPFFPFPLLMCCHDYNTFFMIIKNNNNMTIRRDHVLYFLLPIIWAMYSGQQNSGTMTGIGIIKSQRHRLNCHSLSVANKKGKW